MRWDADFYAGVRSNSAFTSAVTALVYEYKADSVTPYARYQLITAGGNNDLDSTNRAGSRLIQLSVYADSPKLSKEIAENAILGAKSQLSVLDIFERSLGRDPDEEVFGYAVDFTIWFNTP